MASRRASSVESFKVMDVLQRANELQAQGKKVLHLEVGQPESGAPPSVANAAVEALTEPRVMGYTDAFGLLALREKISKYYQKHYGLSPDQVPTDRIVITTGSSGGFLLAFTGCFDAGDYVAIASSGYPCYRNILSALGCNLATIPINEEFKLTASELQSEIARRKEAGEAPIKGLILSSPSNPTGAMLHPDELQSLCRLCESENILFISDEIYHGITYGQKEATALEYSSKALIINSFSKYYSMSGWRLGWMVIPETVLDAINSLQQNMFINAPTLSQTAAMKCWDDDTIVELEKHVEKYRTSRELILNQLKNFTELNAKNIAPADGGFYIYVDLGEENVAPGYGSVKMCEELLETHYVAFTPGNDFEDPATSLGDRRFRISYAGGIETVREAMERFYTFWPTWMAQVKAAKS
ncbi:aspartate aminotransferase [Nitzschia inconspicua]|uniref:Aspartate aminotransferase n=1 Tax=Nitzschia inconspicua TaxID=303405 RepID=A0A9K3PV99_9STRA|nr:aspartate aminotransferase [Nitzschia inconspicua]